MSLQLYANLVSQPSRSVAWLLKVQHVDYELVNVDFGSELLKSEGFRAMNPNGLYPVLKDGEFTLFEGNAILTYLADKFAWTELYPKDLQARAKVNEYLHWHHTNARKFTPQVVLPFFRRSLSQALPGDDELIKGARELIEKELTILEKFFVNDFVARTDKPTVADYALYCECDQLEGMALLDVAKFPKTQAWLARMKELPFHDEIRGDMKGFLNATGLANIGLKE